MNTKQLALFFPPQFMFWLYFPKKINHVFINKQMLGKYKSEL